jgi:hypothetical protein
MRDTSVHIAGELSTWPDKHRMAKILHKGGLNVYVSKYSVRVEDCSHFSFEHYGGDIGEPIIDADADSLDEMMRDAKRVSAALAAAGIRHRFELYDAANEMVGYVHYDWPIGDE